MRRSSGILFSLVETSTSSVNSADSRESYPTRTSACGARDHCDKTLSLHLLLSTAFACQKGPFRSDSVRQEHAFWNRQAVFERACFVFVSASHPRVGSAMFGAVLGWVD